MPLWGFDPYIGFRFLFAIAVIVVVLEWERHTWMGLTLLAITAAAGWLHRRHAPFFGIAALVYIGPCLNWPRARMEFATAIYFAIAVAVGWKLLPGATLKPVVPGNFYPVRAVDILEAAHAEGNAAVPFRWGSYVSWRLAPKIEVSMDGRYEEVYPDETFEINHAFFYKVGANWDELLRRYNVDFILVELPATPLQSDDLRARGYEIVWSGNFAALLARRKLAPSLIKIAANLPQQASESLDARLAERLP